MTTQRTTANSVLDPIQAMLTAPEGAVLAVIAGVEGPSYRPVGAMMTVRGEAERVGTLSSGCIESDISTNALRAAETGRHTVLRYGRGSPFVDIQLPCGGGLDILLLPNPDRSTLAKVAALHAARRPCTLQFNLETGAMALSAERKTERRGDILSVRIEPEIRFLVFGKGPEASTFGALVQSVGYPNLLLSPDDETLADAAQAGCGTRRLVAQAFPQDLGVDDRTAITLFFHDHDWEPPILAGALDTSAFYIGAQGSQRARDTRLLLLEEMGVDDDQRARLHGPVGLVPSARDARTLAVSVLAEILAEALDSAR